MMTYKLLSINTALILFIQPTGGGKLLVCDVHSVLCCGVLLTIVPVLSLGADQRKKVIDKASQSRGCIISIHLDDIKNPDAVNEIIKCTLLLRDETQNTVLLFASLQVIVYKLYWKIFLKDLLTQKLLRLVMVDEIQLFVNYGLSSRHQFSILSNTLFSWLKVNTYTTKITVLFMTATCTDDMFNQLQTLTGLFFIKDKCNVSGLIPLK